MPLSGPQRLAPWWSADYVPGCPDKQYLQYFLRSPSDRVGFYSKSKKHLVLLHAGSFSNEAFRIRKIAA